jgi:hypothetical protein
MSHNHALLALGAIGALTAASQFSKRRRSGSQALSLEQILAAAEKAKEAAPTKTVSPKTALEPVVLPDSMLDDDDWEIDFDGPDPDVDVNLLVRETRAGLSAIKPPHPKYKFSSVKLEKDEYGDEVIVARYGPISDDAAARMSRAKMDKWRNDINKVRDKVRRLPGGFDYSVVIRGANQPA